MYLKKKNSEQQMQPFYRERVKPGMLCFAADFLCFGENPGVFITVQAMAALCTSSMGTDCAENTFPAWKGFSKQASMQRRDVGDFPSCVKCRPWWCLSLHVTLSMRREEA